MYVYNVFHVQQKQPLLNVAIRLMLSLLVWPKWRLLMELCWFEPASVIFKHVASL